MQKKNSPCTLILRSDNSNKRKLLSFLNSPNPINLCFRIHAAKKNYLNFDWSLEVEGHCKWPQRGQNKKQISFCVPHPKNLCIDMHAAKNSFLDFDLLWEVRSHCVWSPRVQIEKLMLFLISPPPKSYVLICMMQKRGHCLINV